MIKDDKRQNIKRINFFCKNNEVTTVSFTTEKRKKNVHEKKKKFMTNIKKKKKLQNIKNLGTRNKRKKMI